MASYPTDFYHADIQAQADSYHTEAGSANWKVENRLEKSSSMRFNNQIKLQDCQTAGLPKRSRK